MLTAAVLILFIVCVLAIVFFCMGLAYLLTEVMDIWRQP